MIEYVFGLPEEGINDLGVRFELQGFSRETEGEK